MIHSRQFYLHLRLKALYELLDLIHPCFFIIIFVLHSPMQSDLFVSRREKSLLFLPRVVVNSFSTAITKKNTYFQAPLSSHEWVIKCFKLISIQLTIAQLLITSAPKASGSYWHKTLSTIIFGTFIMCAFKLRKKIAWNCWSQAERVVFWNAGTKRVHTLNTFGNYLTNQLNYFSCAREIYFVFAGDNKDIAKSRKMWNQLISGWLLIQLKFNIPSLSLSRSIQFKFFFMW